MVGGLTGLQDESGGDDHPRFHHQGRNELSKLATDIAAAQRGGVSDTTIAALH